MKGFIRFPAIIVVSCMCLSPALFAGFIEETAVATVDIAQARNQAHAKVTALRTARQLAYQQLADRLEGLLAAADSGTRDAIAGDRTIQAFSHGYVRGAQVKPGSEKTQVMDDGSILGHITLMLKLPAQLVPESPPDITVTPLHVTPKPPTATPAVAPGDFPTKTPTETPTTIPTDTPTKTPTYTLSEPEPDTITPEADTPVPTDTHKPTETPIPSLTPTPTDTPTPEPTETPAPTDTPIPPADPTEPDTPTPTALQELPVYSGLVINASKIPFEPHDFPAIIARDGRLVYGITPENIRIAYTHGYVRYVTDPEDAEVARFAGDTPVFVDAIEAVPGETGQNLIVSDADADLILATGADGQFLCKCRVIIRVSAVEEDE
jgi:hypothetical protein